MVRRVARQAPEALHTTIVNHAELLYGAYNSVKKSQNLAKVDAFLKSDSHFTLLRRRFPAVCGTQSGPQEKRPRCGGYGPHDCQHQPAARHGACCALPERFAVWPQKDKKWHMERLLGALHRPCRKVYRIPYLLHHAACRLPKTSLCHKGCSWPKFVIHGG